MSMARLASQALNYYQRSSSITFFSPRILLQHRHVSGKATVEVDSDESSTEGDSISIAMKKLDEAVQTFVIQRAAPDWLPFVPGACYWVPPPDPNHPCKSILQILDRLPNTRRRRCPSSSYEDETMSYSSPYGNAQAGSMPVSVEVVMLEPETGATDSDEEY